MTYFLDINPTIQFNSITDARAWFVNNAPKRSKTTVFKMKSLTEKEAVGVIWWFNGRVFYNGDSIGNAIERPVLKNGTLMSDSDYSALVTKEIDEYNRKRRDTEKRKKLDQNRAEHKAKAVKKATRKAKIKKILKPKTKSKK